MAETRIRYALERLGRRGWVTIRAANDVTSLTNAAQARIRNGEAQGHGSLRVTDMTDLERAPLWAWDDAS